MNHVPSDTVEKGFWPTTMYFVHGLPICQKMFCSLHTIGKDCLVNLGDTHGLPLPACLSSHDQKVYVRSADNCLSRKPGSLLKGSIAVSGLVPQAQSAGRNQMTFH